MKYALYSFCLVIIFLSCGKRAVIPEGVHSYVYNNRHIISDIHFFQGGENPGPETITEKQAQEYFLSSFGNFTLDEVRIDFDEMYLYEIKGSSESGNRFFVSNDSLYYNDSETGKKKFSGIIEVDLSRYTYFKTYYFYRFQNAIAKIENSGSMNGVLSYDDAFKKDNLFYSGKEYGFSSHAEMKNEKDVVCWVIVKFVLDKKSK